LIAYMRWFQVGLFVGFNCIYEMVPSGQFVSFDCINEMISCVQFVCFDCIYEMVSSWYVCWFCLHIHEMVYNKWSVCRF